MNDLPAEPEAFTERVARRIAELLPRARIEVSGPLELRIDREPADLSNLYRAVRSAEESEHERLVRAFVEGYLEARRLEQTPLPFEVVRSRILPRIERYEFFRDRRPDFFVHQPFVNDTVILYIIDLNGAVTPLATEQVIRWGLGVEEIDRLARQNLAVQQARFRMRELSGDEGAAAVLDTGDGYDAARILLERLYPDLAPQLGGNFLVAIPARDVFIAFPPTPDRFVDRLRQRIADDYRKLPYPITDDLFLVTLDGVAAWQRAA